jgi:regulator of protease activity HflC (stomatin/prohibitin superfamily)
MEALIVVVVIVAVLLLSVLALAVRIVTQYEQGVLFRLGRLRGTRAAGENVGAEIDQIAQTTLRKVVGQHSLDQTLAATDTINLDIPKSLDATTVDWGVEVTLVELKDIQLPESVKRAMARQAEAEREKRAKIINAEGESMAAAALGEASDTMMAHPLALQLRNLQSLVEIGVDKNTTVVFPAPLMSTIEELGSFLAREQAAARSRDDVSPALALQQGEL